MKFCLSFEQIIKKSPLREAAERYMQPVSYTNRPTEITQKRKKRKRVLLAQNPFLILFY